MRCVRGSWNIPKIIDGAAMALRWEVTSWPAVVWGECSIILSRCVVMITKRTGWKPQSSIVSGSTAKVWRWKPIRRQGHRGAKGLLKRNLKRWNVFKGRCRGLARYAAGCDIYRWSRAGQCCLYRRDLPSQSRLFRSEA